MSADLVAGVCFDIAFTNVLLNQKNEHEEKE